MDGSKDNNISRDLHDVRQARPRPRPGRTALATTTRLRFLFVFLSGVCFALSTSLAWLHHLPSPCYARFRLNPTTPGRLSSSPPNHASEPPSPLASSRRLVSRISRRPRPVEPSCLPFQSSHPCPPSLSSLSPLNFHSSPPSSLILSTVLFCETFIHFVSTPLLQVRNALQGHRASRLSHSPILSPNDRFVHSQELFTTAFFAEPVSVSIIHP
jgi:hypothetical protein